VLDLEEGVKYPVCIGGKRNCPPEDIGGRGDMRIFLKQSRTHSIQSMNLCLNGWEALLTLKNVA